MNNKNIENNVELDLRVSCDIFWKYEMKVKIDKNDYIESDNRDEINNGCCDHCKSPTFSRLERYLCDTMIAYIHEDLAMNGHDEKIAHLCEKSGKFHIHGHTTHSLLQLQSNRSNPEERVYIYICTHC